MDKRERPIYKGIFFSEQEWQQVATKMAESDMAVERITKPVLFYRLVKLIIIGP